MYLELRLVGEYLATLKTIMAGWLASLLFHLKSNLAFLVYTLQVVPHLAIRVSLVLLLLLDREDVQQLVELILALLLTTFFPHIQDQIAKQKYISQAIY